MVGSGQAGTCPAAPAPSPGDAGTRFAANSRRRSRAMNTPTAPPARADSFSRSAQTYLIPSLISWTAPKRIRPLRFATSDLCFHVIRTGGALHRLQEMGWMTRRRCAALGVAYTAAVFAFALALAPRDARAATSVIVDDSGLNYGVWWDEGCRGHSVPRRGRRRQSSAARRGGQIGHHRPRHPLICVVLSPRCADVTMINTTVEEWFTHSPETYSDSYWWNQKNAAQVRLGRTAGGLGAEAFRPCSSPSGMVTRATAAAVPLHMPGSPA